VQNFLLMLSLLLSKFFSETSNQEEMKRWY